MTKPKVKFVEGTASNYVFKVTRGKLEVKELHFNKYRPKILYQGDLIKINKDAFWAGQNRFVAL